MLKVILNYYFYLLILSARVDASFCATDNSQKKFLSWQSKYYSLVSSTNIPACIIYFLYFSMGQSEN